MKLARMVASLNTSGRSMCLVMLLNTLWTTAACVDSSNETELESVTSFNGSATSKAPSTYQTDATVENVSIWIWIVLSVGTVALLLVLCGGFLFWLGGEAEMMDSEEEEEDSIQEQQKPDHRCARKQKRVDRDKAVAVGGSLALPSTFADNVQLTKSRIQSGVRLVKRKLVQAGKTATNKIKEAFAANKGAKKALKIKHKLKKQLNKLKKLTPVDDFEAGTERPATQPDAQTPSPTSLSPTPSHARDGPAQSARHSPSMNTTETGRVAGEDGFAAEVANGARELDRDKMAESGSQVDANSDLSRAKHNVAYKKQ